VGGGSTDQYPLAAAHHLDLVERNFGYGVARAYAGHTDTAGDASTTTYIRASVQEVARALAALVGEPHPSTSPSKGSPGPCRSWPKPRTSRQRPFRHHAPRRRNQADPHHHHWLQLIDGSGLFALCKEHNIPARRNPRCARGRRCVVSPHGTPNAAPGLPRHVTPRPTERPGRRPVDCLAATRSRLQRGRRRSGARERSVIALGIRSQGASGEARP
jgi:hypothetical protein